MALPAASNAISLGAIQTEFGGANPISMSEYYKNGGGGYVVTADTAPNVPTSGAITFGNFHSAAKAGVLETTNWTASDVVTGATSVAESVHNTDGTTTLSGNVSTTPSTPKWWTNTSPAATWMSYSSTGAGTITGGLAASTRYQLNVSRTLGVTRTTFGVSSRTFTISYYDASSGGTLLGTRTFTASAERQ